MNRSSGVQILIFAVWIVPLSLALSVMLGLHYAPHKLEQLTGFHALKNLEAHHFLSEQCNCSNGVLDHLLERHARVDAREVVHLIHGSKKLAEKLNRAGFEVEFIQEEVAVQKHHLTSIPQLLVMKDGYSIYQGGYGPDQQHVKNYFDEMIIENTRKNVKTTDYPLFGCANGHLAKKKFDLLGVKFGNDPTTESKAATN